MAIHRLVATFDALLLASDSLQEDSLLKNAVSHLEQHAVLRPDQNEVVAYWFARYLSVRETLWELINETTALVDVPMKEISTQNDWRLFLIGYSAACLLVRNDRYMLFDVAKHSNVQRKLNEPFAEYRIPRKQFTYIYSAYVNRRDTLRIYDAIRVAGANRLALEKLRSDNSVAVLAEQLPLYESWLVPSKRRYVAWLFSYLSHKIRRKGVVSLNNALARVVERLGRTASEVKLPISKRVNANVLAQIQSLLQPGDIFITRHDHALTNLFIPGYWPHASFYIGTREDREQLGIQIKQDQSLRWCGSKCTFEALKDGVHFRALEETLAVDNVVIVRPRLASKHLAKAIERVVRHEGKAYNFDFDFFSSDSLVCSEVVYRALDGIGGIEFPLTERAGRFKLSPQDLLNYAVKSAYFDVVAAYGLQGNEQALLEGSDAERLLGPTLQAS